MAFYRTRASSTPHQQEVHQIIEEERDRTDISAVMMLGVMALFIAFGLWFYATSDERNVATDDRPPASQTTTGAGNREAPLPNTPTPPTVPPQPPR